MMSSISVTSCFPPFYGINPLPLFLEIYINYTVVIIILTDTNIAHDNCTDYAVRLIGGVNAKEGIPQICLNRVWGTFCYKSTNRYDVDAGMICQEVGYNTG